MRFCELCRKPEDLNHLFLNCPLYEGPRRHLVQNVGVNGHQGVGSAESVEADEPEATLTL